MLRHQVNVELGERRYPIHIGHDLHDDLQALGVGDSKRPAVLVTNRTIEPLHGQRWRDALALRHPWVLQVVLEDGEAHKTWDSVDAVITPMLQQAFDRKTTLYALGGGVVGDLSGFAASCYMRGIDFVQIPTTLLAQVDSSVGGKTAINHAAGKNLIGAFHQPKAVLADLGMLSTLPDREYAAGLAEVVKYGPIWDGEFLDWLESQAGALRARDPEALAYAIKRSCEIKAAVVGQDERESDLRAILNFGHTFGHAIEAELGYGSWLHGEAIAVGMLMASRLSESRGGPAGLTERLEALLVKFHLPIRHPSIDPDAFLRWMRVDKKASAGEIRYVLIAAMGQAQMVSVPDDEVRPIIEAFGV